MISFIKNNWFAVSVFNIIVIYLVGLLGICNTNEMEQQLFLKLTPINLIITTGYALFFHNNWNKKFIISIIVLFLFGYTIEVIGVKTSAIFGSYYYGNTLGIKLLDVPLMMGLNWLLLIYVIACTLYKVNNHLLFALLAACIMTSLDLLIEPIAQKLDFWQWENDIIPIQNYVAWYVISICLFLLFRILNGKIENKFSIIILLIQFVFFGILNMFLK